MTRKLGRLAAVHDPRVPPLRAVLAAEPPPAECNWFAAVDSWPPLSNLSLGDCVPAAALHCIQQRMEYALRPVTPTDDEAIALYSSWAGYVPGNPATDNGTLMSAALAQWARECVMVGGEKHELTAYASVEHLSASWLKRAIWRCGGVLLGFSCPAIWLEDVNPYLLDFDGDLPELAGGHCVYLCGYEQTGLGVEYDTISWGMRLRMTERALLRVSDEAYCILSQDWLDRSGLDPAGVAWADALSAMATIRA